jgi:hypothetical protein
MTAGKNPTLSVVGLCAAGHITGFSARRLSPAPPPRITENDNTRNERHCPSSPRMATSATAPDLASFPERPSTETAESQGPD